jgi:hypothetical protein
VDRVWSLRFHQQRSFQDARAGGERQVSALFAPFPTEAAVIFAGLRCKGTG